jgi:glutathione S-transferase
MLKFYMTPGSCSTGIHILLEELELVFEAYIINLLAGDNRKPEYLAINPRGSVPALVREDGTSLIEFREIARWLGEAYPRKKLLPPDAKDQARAFQIMDYAVGVVHGEGFTRVFVPDRYATIPAEQRESEAEGRAIVARGLKRLASMLAGPYALEEFSVADAALFYIEFWSERVEVELPAACRTHYETMLQRRSVRQVLAEEGYAATLRKYPATAEQRFRRA